MADTASAAEMFGVPIEGSDVDRILERVEGAEKPVWIVTANPEILLYARKDEIYRKALSGADVRTVDGFGLFLALKLLRRKISRVTGVELAEHLLQLAYKHEWKVGLIGGDNGVAKKAAKEIAEAYQGLAVHAEGGGRVQMEGEDDREGEEARHRMTMFAPDILLVAFGHPKQEFWIEKHREDFPRAKAIVGVGGAFDFWSGRVKRAPFLMRDLGLEWLWRLVQQPSRWKRIWNAVATFPFLFVLDIMKRKGN